MVAGVHGVRMALAVKSAVAERKNELAHVLILLPPTVVITV